MLYRIFLGKFRSRGHFSSPFMYPQTILFSEDLHLFVESFLLLSSVVNLYIPVVTLITFTSTLIYT